MKEQIELSPTSEKEYQEIETSNSKYCDEIINSLLKKGKYKVITKRQPYTCGSSPVEENIEDEHFVMDSNNFDIRSLKIFNETGNEILEYIPKRVITIDKGEKTLKHYLKIKN